MSSTTVHWFRRDLRLKDNTALSLAHQKGNVLGLFIFDTNILDELEDRDDARVSFIHDSLTRLGTEIKKEGGALLVRQGDPIEVWKQLIAEFAIQAVFTNEDYEPYAGKRDQAVGELLQVKGISFTSVKDQVILAKDEVLKDDGKPYTVYTPYSRKWKTVLRESDLAERTYKPNWDNQISGERLSLEQIGFSKSNIQVDTPQIPEQIIRHYHETRDFPGLNGISHMSVHLRFGTISIRELFRQSRQWNEKYINELIWREFYQMILWHFPHVVTGSFKPAYDAIQWPNNEPWFQAWCEGRTGFPIVDAGMRELNATGFMHNRARMITASFLCKDLLIDWRLGEAYFARKLLDFDLASNNGGWQWAAGTGCDAAPYFRIFNPHEQARKFDPDGVYIRRWVAEFDSLTYPQPIVDHKVQREKALKMYMVGLGGIS
ncbi:MAG: deoxyribodipyrimidine photo-lyase [Lewinellaceae bacterium]|nr:deoxyribodipyrimidine photo-lyase [Lewinellaceae bacterium]